MSLSTILIIILILFLLGGFRDWGNGPFYGGGIHLGGGLGLVILILIILVLMEDMMPLKKSSSKSAFKSNVKEMVKAGHPIKQSLAAAYSTKRAASKPKKGKY